MDENQDAFDRFPKLLIAIIGSTYCFISLIVLLIVPILQIAIGGAYRNQCTINPNIPVYLIVSGVFGMSSILLALAIIGAFLCYFKRNSIAGTIAVTVVLALIFLTIFFMSIFLFIWFIVGSVWVFSAKKNVDFDNINSPNYCHPTLYNFAFVILILSYIGCAISCCCSCIRSATTVAKGGNT